MGFVVVGVAAAAYANGSTWAEDGVIALNGAVLQMFNHGLSAAGMFFLVGVIYERAHTRNLNDFVGLFFTGAYILKVIKKVLHGPLNEQWEHHGLADINFREVVVMAPLMVMMLWIGIWPAWILNVINEAMKRLF